MKFILLIIGTILAPALGLAPFVLRELNDPSGRVPPGQYMRLRRSLQELQAQDPDQIAATVRKIAPLAEVLVLQDGQVVFSTAADSLSAFISMEGAFDFSRVDSSTPGLSVVIGFPLLRSLGSRGGYPLVIFVGSMLVFMILMSVLIIRSINRSINRLEEATRRISAGDLDFRLEAGGSDRIASLTRSFEAMRRRVQEETAARSRFLMAVSHDLKTPLASITGYLDAIQEGLAEDKNQLDKYLSIIRDKTGVLQGRIRQLIDFVKLNTTGRRIPESVQLQPFLEEAVTVFAAEAEARGFAFHSTLGIDPALELSMEADLVLRVLENLVHNAFGYAVESSIDFSVQQTQHAVLIRVCNAGEIAAEDRELIFEPFYRGSRSRSEDGFGLGLSVVKSVVQSHGWEIVVDSKDLRTCFLIRIPLPGPQPGAAKND
jgi:signal transduction histidine kinase